MSLFLTFLLVSGLCLSFSTFGNSISNGDRFSNGGLVEASCPLDFDVLRRLMSQGPSRPMFIDMPTPCQSILQAIRLVRSEYLRNNGYFLPPPETSAACWEAYRDLVSEFLKGFDIKTACGYQPEWISEACINVTSLAQFESLIPESKLLEIRHHCNQSLENRFACGSCISKLLSLREFYLQDSESVNVSDCSGYPSMYAAGIINQFGPTDRATASCLFFIRFYSEPSRFNRRKFVISGVVLGCIIGILGALSAVWFIWIRTRRSKGKRNNSLHRENDISPNDDTSLVLGSGSRGTNLVKFKIEEIKSATMNFSWKNIIGKGGYGNVYKGTLPDGTEVAFKRFKNCSAIGDANFKHEVEIIASVKHVNLVTLRGYCTTAIPMGGHQRIIVCDLLHNGSLYDHLFGSAMKKLSWPIRQKIALGTARGLAYLHYGVQPAIIHRDIKSSNILLDETFEPKVADFGLAKINHDGMTHLTTRVAGTLGYVSPEYALYGKLTTKSDVYSYGVVLLELLSGKKACEIKDGKTLLLTDWAWGLVKEGRTMDVIEDNIPELGLPQIMEQYVLTAVLCAHPILHARLTMEQLVKILESNFSVSSVLRAYVDSSSPSSNRELISVNFV
ncbi:probable LRR receptor-like serine/threonine-protein kinase RKF3 [Pistacia vera]|uniref:probable LRR receptor-like serine/threonine-protein kinase RKF3 n=1 Tax=Pistacia vera TaxID=55513 RepID=UPI0012630307|nr:probable LRR receptor-like serine/threonine-protein kinase RKF3 [Pistacia vera]